MQGRFAARQQRRQNLARIKSKSHAKATDGMRKAEKKMPVAAAGNSRALVTQLSFPQQVEITTMSDAATKIRRGSFNDIVGAKW